MRVRHTQMSVSLDGYASERGTSAPHATTTVAAPGRLAHLAARIGLSLHGGVDRAHRLTRDFASGLCLGLFSDETLTACCTLGYDDQSQFRSAEYNRSGLRDWEQRFVDGHLCPGMKVLVTSAGGGREVVALHRQGFEVVAFECQPRLAAWGRAFLRSEGVPVEIRQASPDRLPVGLPNCDAVLVGWGAYAHIRPAAARIEFLRTARALIPAGRPLLVSFLGRGAWSGQRARRLANHLRRLRGREHVESGDVFGPPPMHLFTRSEIDAELDAARFRIDRFEGEGSYPHAVAIAVD